MGHRYVGRERQQSDLQSLMKWEYSGLDVPVVLNQRSKNMIKKKVNSVRL